jgi:antitoxin Phd
MCAGQPIAEIVAPDLVSAESATPVETGDRMPWRVACHDARIESEWGENSEWVAAAFQTRARDIGGLLPIQVTPEANVKGAGLPATCTAPMRVAKSRQSRQEAIMANRVWRLHDARNRFSEVVDKALAEGPQIVTRRGEEVVVIVAKEEYARLRKSRPSLVEFFRSSPLVGVDLDLERDRSRPRELEL